MARENYYKIISQYDMILLINNKYDLLYLRAITNDFQKTDC